MIDQHRAEAAPDGSGPKAGFIWLITAMLILLLLQGCGSMPKGSSSVLLLGDGLVVASDEAGQPEIRQALMSQFREWRGTPYRLGGNSKAGIDCSAFVQQTLSQYFDLKVPRSTAEQVHVGALLTQGKVQAGDLLFFRTGINTRHVGFYLGKGEFLHASTTVGVTISRLDEAYWRKSFWKARRVL